MPFVHVDSPTGSMEHWQLTHTISKQMDLVGDLVFRGDSGQEAEDFIRLVNIQAFKMGKLEDHKWITGFGLTAFSGKALRWYRGLPLNIRQNWDLLQEALLAQVWEEGPHLRTVPIAPSADTMSTPAAAPPMAERAPFSFQPQEDMENDPAELSAHLRGWKTGRIRIIVEDPPVTGYLRLRHGETRFSYSSDESQAVGVRWNPVSFPCKLEMTNSQSPYCLIGGQFWKDNDTFSSFGSGETGHLCLTPVTDPSKGPFKSLLRDHFSGAYARGSGFCTFWNVLQDGSLLASVQQKTCAYRLEGLVSRTTGWIWLASDPDAVISMWPESQSTVAKFFLEQISET